MNLYMIDTANALKELKSTYQGLTHAESRERLAKNGPNALPEGKRATYLGMFVRQFRSPLIYMLLAATVAVLALGEIADASIIAAVLVINAIIGTVQEGRAQNALLALKKLVSSESVVLRDGQEVVIPSSELVVGDIVILREGDKVSADARIIQSDSVMTDESALTGESLPIEKNIQPLDRSDVPVADQTNMVWSGTYIVGGAGLAVVSAIGARTVIGAISAKLVDLDTELPLKAQIRKLSKILLIVVAVSSAALFVAGIAMGINIREMFSIVVAVAVSVTPEGLPVVVTLILAAGVSRMSKKHALVKNLQAVEALGQADIIAVDKTGTITLNQMMVTEIRAGKTVYEISGEGYKPEGVALIEGSAIKHQDVPCLMAFAQAAALTSSAHFGFSEELQTWQRISGDPTEVALAVAGAKLGFSKESIHREHTKFFEEPFTSQARYHAVAYENNGKRTMYVAGAPEVMIGLSNSISAEDAAHLKDDIESMSERGLRVIALAKREVSHEEGSEPDVSNLTFLGFAGIADTLRTSVKASVSAAHQAGIRVVMITGDYSTTAQALASQVGIFREGDTVITGENIITWSPDELASKIGAATVFARVAPEHKMAIIQAYRKAGFVVAMTGDGVNDALPLAAADLGVSMGKIGTEVAKEASDIVLLDDDFGSIVLAIEEGRAIYRSIKKVVLYLLSTSLAELIVIGGALALGLPIPLSATQIIWLNFVTDGFLVAALAAGRKEEGLLRRAWTAIDQSLVDKVTVIRMFIMSAVMAAGTLAVFTIPGMTFPLASTMALTTLAAYQWFNAFNCSSDTSSVLGKKLWSNPYLVVSFFAVIGLHAAILYVPFLGEFFDTVPLYPREILVAVAVALSVVVADECFKLGMRILNKNQKQLQ